MGLSTSLNTAVGGLNASQAGMGVVSQNVANAGRAGYIRREISTVEGNTGSSTNTTPIQRLLDKVVQHQLWQETSSAAYTSTRSNAMSQLDKLYGAPGSANALDTIYNKFTSSLQALQNDPANYSLRSAVMDAASALATRLNGLSDGVQAQRQQAEANIGEAVKKTNSLLESLTTLNARITGRPQDAGTAELKDQRDRVVAELAQYMDIKTSENDQGSLSIITTSGTQIFDGKPAVKFEFDERSNVGPNSKWDADPTKRGVGTLIMRDGNGGTQDAIANNIFRSGTIAANIELRDRTLIQSQGQLDEMASQMSRALSDRNIPGTPVNASPDSGFDVDMNGLQAGNRMTLEYKVLPGGAVRKFTFVRTDSAAALPLPQSASGDANNTVVGINFSGGAASVASQIQAAIGNGFTVSATGSTLRVLNDSTVGTREVTGLSAQPTATGISGGTSEFPFFVDGKGNVPFTGSYEGGSQTTGFASRIAINPALLKDRAGLVVSNTSPATAQGDATRPKFMLERLTKSQRDFTDATGMDGQTATSSQTVSSFVQRVVSSQGQAAEAAKRLDEGQQIALAAVQSRFQSTSQVSVDKEMSTLIELQAAYAANARIISTVKEMMDVLLRV